MTKSESICTNKQHGHIQADFTEEYYRLTVIEFNENDLKNKVFNLRRAANIGKTVEVVKAKEKTKLYTAAIHVMLN